MKTTVAEWQERLFLFLFFGFIATALMGPIAGTSGIPDLADYVNHLAAIIQAKMAFIEGQFPLRIAPYVQSGWRYPFFQFYSPTTYTIAGTIYWLFTPSNPLLAYKVTVWLALLSAGLYMYKLSYWFIRSKPAALLASVVYLSSPYYIIVVNRLGNLSETIALAIVPAAVYYTLQRYMNPTKDKTLLQASLAWYLLMTTHFVTFAYTSFLMAIWLVLLTLQRRQHWRNLTHTAIAYLFACVLATWHLAPILFLSKYFLLSDTYSSSVHLNYFHPLLSYLFSPSALITNEFQNALFKLHPGVGWPILLAAGFSFYAFIKKQKSGHTLADHLIPTLLILFAIAFFMAWSPFDFWKYLPKQLFVAQYSWRLLSQVIWIGAILFAWAITVLFDKPLDKSHAILGTFFILMCGSQWIPGIKYSTIDLDEFIKHPVFVYNHNAYAIDFTKHIQFVSHIDSMLIEPEHKLTLNKPYKIHRELLNIAAFPTISVEGEIKEKIAPNQQLIASLNHKPIATQPLKTGKLQWNITLPAAAALPRDTQPLTLQFSLQDTNTHKEITTLDNLYLDQILLTGFLNPAETLFVKQTELACHRENSKTLCKIEVGSSIKLLELPILYYPKLMSITLNGKPVTPQGLMYQGNLLTAITPLPGMQNNIEIQFNGLSFANDMSLLGWGIWLFVLMSIGIKYLKRVVFARG